MPAFERKTAKFGQTMNWNRSIDTIPDGQAALQINVRTPQQGETTTRPGLTVFTAPTGSPTYIHTMSRLNNYSANLPFFTYVYVVGGDTKLYVGKTNADFGNAAINPVKMPPGGSTTALSGNPLTVVDTMPIGGLSGWKYVGDSSGMYDVGYYPGDTPGTNMARSLTMGMVPPVFDPAMTLNGGGLLNGSYQWFCVYRRKYTGAVSNPSAATRYTQAVPAAALTNQSVTFTLPTTPIDPQTGSADANVVVDVYRFGGTVFRWAYVGTDTSGASFTDNLPDSAILTAPAPTSQVTDAVTGVTRFNTYMPFPTQDIGRFSTSNATASKVAGGDGTNTIWILTAGGADTFNTNLVQGSSISINNALYTVYQVRSSTVIEILEDATGTLTDGSTYPWAIPAGQLVMGTPCPHIWGPYGTGSSGSVVFGCGAANAQGILFWTNGNDPDGADVTGSLQVTSPSEPLTGGCVFNGVPYVFSTERMFRIYPQIGTGQFYTQEIGGGKGLWMEWSLTVQSNSISDVSITWRGKDGIYNYTEGGGVQSLTDETMFPLFPHDNQAGSGIGTGIGASLAAGTVFPVLNSGFTIPPPDDTQPKYQRLIWHQGQLYFDYAGLYNTGSMSANWYTTLVFDAREAKGWVSFDAYSGGTAGFPTSRMTEIGANNLKMSFGNTIYNFTGVNDNGSAILSTVITKQDDQGDARGEKLYGDLMFDVDPGGSGGVLGVIVAPLVAYGATSTPTASTAFTVSGRQQGVVKFSTDGLGVLSRTFGLEIQWTATGAATTLYQYVLDWVPKPEITVGRATDKTDDGYPGAKYMRGAVVEANTFNVTRKVNFLVDGVAVTNPVTGTTVFAVKTNGQLEVPFAFTPAVGYELQIAIDATDTATAGWELFQVRWVYEQWPDNDQKQSAVIEPAGGKLVYIRGFVLPVDTGGTDVTPAFMTDLAVGTGLTKTNTNGKTGVAYTLNPPLLAHNVIFTPNAPWRAWYNEIQWDAEPWPEKTIEVSPRLTPAGGKPCHLRGFTMPIDTAGAAVTFLVEFEDGTTAQALPVQTTYNEALSSMKAPVGFYLDPPQVVHQVQIQPQSATRCWFGEIVWDAEPWPEIEPEYSPWISPRNGRRTYLRAFSMPVDTGGVVVPFRVQLASGGVVTPQVSPGSTTAAQKTTLDFTFIPPVVTHELRIQPQGGARCWWEEIVFDAEEYPELDNDYSPVLDLGSPRAKFLQGCLMVVDTQGVDVTLTFVGDSGVVGTTQTVNAQGKQFIALAWPPFITHEIQIIKSDAASIWWNEIQWVYEPEPELAVIWQTPFMTHGMSGYQHQRLFWVAYLAASSVVLARSFDNGTTETYVLPATGGVYRKALVVVQPTKYLAESYQATSPAAFRLYAQDTEMHTKQWGSDGGYQVVRPVGSQSVVKGADI